MAQRVSFEERCRIEALGREGSRYPAGVRPCGFYARRDQGYAVHQAVVDYPTGSSRGGLLTPLAVVARY